jgi:small subunit ribosomal protein S5
LTKSLGSANVLNVATATLDALQSLKRVEDEAAQRGLPADQLRPFWERRRHG